MDKRVSRTGGSYGRKGASEKFFDPQADKWIIVGYANRADAYSMIAITDGDNIHAITDSISNTGKLPDGIENHFEDFVVGQQMAYGREPQPSMDEYAKRVGWILHS